MSQKPKLIIITGRPGSGKTTLAKELGTTLNLPVVSRDEIKEGYVNTFKVRYDELPKDTNKTATEIFFKNIDFLLENNISLVAEAAFQHKVWEPEISKFQSAASLFMIICDIDPDLAAKRHLQRGLDNPKREFFQSDNRVAQYRKTGVVLPPGDYEAPSLDVPTLKVSTENGYSPDLKSIAEKILT